MKKVSKDFKKKLKKLNKNMKIIMGNAYRNAFSLIEDLPSVELKNKTLQMIHNEEENIMEHIKDLTSIGYTIDTIPSRILTYIFEYNEKVIQDYKEQLNEYPKDIVEKIMYITSVFKFCALIKYYIVITLCYPLKNKINESLTLEDLLEDVKFNERFGNKERIIILCNILSNKFVTSHRTLDDYYNIIFDKRVMNIVDYIICDLDDYSYYLYLQYKDEVSRMNNLQFQEEMNVSMEVGDYRSAVLEIEYYHRQFQKSKKVS